MKLLQKKKIFIRLKLNLKKIETFIYSSIEWRALNFIELDNNKSQQIFEIVTALEELDDVQNIFTNAKLKNLQ